MLNIRLVIKGALLALILVVLAGLNPFGLTSASDRYSEEIIDKVLAPFYRSDSQEAVTVILVDRLFLDELGEGWPLSYQRQSLLLENILSFKPNTLFVDFLYQYQHSSDSALLQYLSVFEEFKEEVTIIMPVLAKPRSASIDTGGATSGGQAQKLELNDAFSPCKQGLAENSADVADFDSMLPAFRGAPFKHAIAQWSGCDGRYPVVFHRESEPHSVAYEMLRAMCKGGSDVRGCESIRDNAPLSEFYEPMHIRWGSRISDAAFDYSQKFGPACQAQTLTFWQAAHESLRLLKSGIVEAVTGQGFSIKRYGCPYVTTISALQVRPGSDERERIISRLITGKAVLLGMGIDVVSDYEDTPVNGKVPAVVTQAMAVENLLSNGSNYSVDLPEIVQILIEYLVLFGALLWSYRYFQHRKMRSFDGFFQISIEFVKSIFMLLLLPSIVLFLVCATFYFVFQIAPINWVGLMGAVSLTYIVNLDDKLDYFLRISGE